MVAMVSAHGPMAPLLSGLWQGRGGTLTSGQAGRRDGQRDRKGHGPGCGCGFVGRALVYMQEIPSLASHKLDVVVPTRYPSAQEVEVSRSEVQGHP